MIPRRLVITTALLLLVAVALAGYVLRLKHSTENSPAATLNTQPIVPPVAGAATPVTLFLANDADGSLHKITVNVVLPQEPAERAREILHALVQQYQQRTSPHPLGPGADITEVYLVKDGLAVINANAAFAEQHRSGIMVEELTLASLAETLAANLPTVTRIKLLIDGQERATLAGHADLSEPYNVAEAARMVRN